MWRFKPQWSPIRISLKKQKRLKESSADQIIWVREALITKYALSKAFPIGFRLEKATGPFDLMVKKGQKEILVGVDIATEEDVLLIPAKLFPLSTLGAKTILSQTFS